MFFFKKITLLFGYRSVSPDNLPLFPNSICQRIYLLWFFFKLLLKKHFAHGENPAQFFTFYWSPDGARLAFLRSDRSLVPIFNFMYYGPPEDTYPEVIDLKYSMAGEPNPHVTVKKKKNNEKKIKKLGGGTKTALSYSSFLFGFSRECVCVCVCVLMLWV